jgi:hypothetical protein
MSHNLGAVQWSAPHTSKSPSNGPEYGHCWDGFDVMCYADGPFPAHPMTYPCPQIAGVITQSYDCGGDDYFNVDPADGSYLATRWNLYDSAFLGTCTEVAPACGGDGAGTVPVPPVSTADPRITGAALEGQTLIATRGEWLNTPDAYAYRWERAASGAPWSAIPGASGASHVLGPADVGGRVRVVVTARNADGATAVASAPTAVVAALPVEGTPTGPGPAAPSPDVTVPAPSVPAQPAAVPLLSSGRSPLEVTTGRDRGLVLGRVSFALADGRLTAKFPRARLAGGRYTIELCVRGTSRRCATKRTRVRGSRRPRRVKLPAVTLAVPDATGSVTLTVKGRRFAARIRPVDVY